MRSLYFICKSFVNLDTLRSILMPCFLDKSALYTINENNVLSINYEDEKGCSIEYIGIEPDDIEDTIYECGEDSEIYKEFYCNEDFPNASVFWVRYSLSTSDAYLLCFVLRCLKNGKLDFLVNNGRHGNFLVDKFIESAYELI
jgi:hypothetical protein